MIYQLTIPKFFMPVGQKFKRVSASNWKIIFNEVEYPAGAVSSQLEAVKNTHMEEVEE